jgi:hypothetical protein
LQNIIVYRFLQIFVYFLKLLKLLAMVIVMRRTTKSLAWSICLKFLRFIIPISELDLFLTAIFLLLNIQENIFPFLLSACVNIVLNIVVENYTNRKL